MRRISFLLIMFLIFSSVANSQNISAGSITKLKGMEDKKGNTHLFYNYEEISGNNLTFSETNDVRHLDVEAGTDSIFFAGGGYQSPQFSLPSTYINDFFFWENNPAKYFYTGNICGMECGIIIGRYDNIQITLPDFNYWYLGISIEKSMQNDSILYGGFPILCKSTDGGRNWSVIDSSLNFKIVAVSPFNDKIIFAQNYLPNLSLWRSDDGGLSFKVIDSTGAFSFYNKFLFDSDSVHIYAAANKDGKYHLIVSDAKGDSGSWKINYSSLNKIILSEGSPAPGQIYIADGNMIFISHNFGKSFSPVDSVSDVITGIYKTTKSDKLYISAGRKIYEISTAGINIIKQILVNSYLLELYPLNTGDRWYYSGAYISYPDKITRIKYFREVTGKFTGLNNKIYNELKETGDLLPKPVFYYERIDSMGGKVYRYSKDSVNSNYEYLIDDLTGKTGSSSRSYRFGNSEPTYIISQNDTTIFGKNVNTIEYYSGRSENCNYKLAGSYGLVNIKIRDTDFEYNYSLSGAVINGKIYGDTSLTGVLGPSETPSNFELKQNYPNPFNPSTAISFTIPHREFVTLKVYDVLGRLVATLVNEEKNTGTYKVEFNSNNLLPTTNHSLSSGVYFYRLEAGSLVSTKKMIVIK